MSRLYDLMHICLHACLNVCFYVTGRVVEAVEGVCVEGNTNMCVCMFLLTGGRSEWCTER